MSLQGLPNPSHQVANPWEVGPQPMYNHAMVEQALHGVHWPSPEHASSSPSEWERSREQILRDWGKQRESNMHREPKWCMDQLCSGSCLYPPRLLDETWFTTEEKEMIKQLERLLAPTGQAEVLSRDMMALKMYDIDVRIILDDSGSMNAGMMSDGGWRSNNEWTRDRMQKVFGNRAFQPDSIGAFAGSPYGPVTQRWHMAQDALTQWEQVFKILGLKRKIYLLNRDLLNRACGGSSYCGDEVDRIFSQPPRGGTPMGSTLLQVLQDRQRDSAMGKCPSQTCLILALTDGEANDKTSFVNTLDDIQDGLWGDVQVCLLGLSLDKEDIDFFEDEECDDTRIRTIEPWEVEQQQILWRKVIQRPGDYNFAMHTFRALVTNFFPADYDYEAPVQTLRHRLYITLHAIDRRLTGVRDRRYYDSGLNRQTALNGSTLGCLAFLPFLCGAKGILVVPGLAGAAWYYNAKQQNKALRSTDCPAEDLDYHLLGLLNDSDVEGMVCSLRDAGLCQEPSFGRCRRGCSLTRKDSYALRKIQAALGALAPAEWISRDLQYADSQDNDRQLRRATQLLK